MTETMQSLKGRQVRLHNRRCSVFKTDAGYLLQWKRLGIKEDGEPRVVKTQVQLSAEAFDATWLCMREMRPAQVIATTIEIPEYHATVASDGTTCWEPKP